jgi:hypothetical protein
VVDEHDLACAQPSLRYRQRADHVIGDHAACVAQDVRLAVSEAQRREHVQARVHTRNDSQPAVGTDIEVSGRQ